MKILIKNIPKWLRDSELYETILENADGDLDEEVSIKSKYLKENENIENITEFTQVYFACKYWLMDYPETFYRYAILNKKEVLKFFYSELDEANEEINMLIDELTESEVFTYESIFFEGEFEVIAIIIKMAGGDVLLFINKDKNNKFFEIGNIKYNIDKFSLFKKIGNNIINNIEFAIKLGDYYTINYSNNLLIFENEQLAAHEHISDRLKLKITKFNRFEIGQNFKDINSKIINTNPIFTNVDSEQEYLNEISNKLDGSKFIKLKYTKE